MLAVLCTGCDNETFRALVVSHGDGGIGFQRDFPLVTVLVLGQDLLFGVVGRASFTRRTSFTRGTSLTSFTRFSGARTGRFLETVVGLLQEGEVVVEHFEVQRAVDVQVAVAVNGISQTGTVVKLRTTCPAVAGIIRGIGIQPVEDGQFVQWQLVAGGDLLLIVERGAQMTDTVEHRVFPGSITVGIEILVHRSIRLFNLRTGSRLEIEVEVTREVPPQGEVAVPKELLVEHQFEILVLKALKVAFLQFVVATAHLGIERDALRQVVDTDGLGEVQPLRLALEVLEGLPGLIDGRVAVVQRPAPLVILLVDSSLARGVTM